jgi:protein-S-isoprenylcysteine O-methyltransferase Ste14
MPNSLQSPAPASRAVTAGELIPSDFAELQASHSKSLFEKNRVALSWLSCLTLGGMTVVTQSQWSLGGLMSGTLLLVGLSLAVVGCIGRIWCSLFIDGFKTKQLVTAGPYSLCRNPLYFFSAIGAIGVAFGSATFVLPALVAIAFATYYPMIIRAEERRLIVLHGSLFQKYGASVPAFFPKLNGPISADTYQIHVKIVGRSMLEATWFIWFTMIAHLLFQLHQRTNYLPALFTSF